MHQRIGIAKRLWKLLFEAALSHIDPDTRGYDDIFAYFDEYVNFEELIFASDSFYRDHTLHCLWVYFLGEYIRKSDDYKDVLIDEWKQTQMIIEAYEKSFRSSKHGMLFEDFLYISDIVNQSVENRDAIWCITSLTHDLGYPIKKISKINKSIQKILPYFHVKNYDEFNFDFTDVQQSFIDDFIKLMSYGIEIGFNISTDEYNEKNKEFDEILNKILTIENEKLVINDHELDKLNEIQYKKIQEYINKSLSIKMKIDFTKRLSFYNDFEHYEHGIMSAYLLMKTIYSFSTFKFRYNDYNNILHDEVDVTKFISIREILNAVTNHTCSRFQMADIRGNSEFLAFVDELEEFSRISRSNQNRQYIEEFCKTDLSFVDGWFHIDFIFDNEND